MWTLFYKFPQLSVPGYRDLNRIEATKLSKKGKRAWKRMDPNLRSFVDKKVGPFYDLISLAVLALVIHLNHMMEAMAEHSIRQRLAAQNAGADTAPVTTIHPVPPFNGKVAAHTPSPEQAAALKDIFNRSGL